MKEKLIEQFVESSTIDAMHKLLESSDAKELSDMAVILADTFGAGKAFKAIVDDNENGETKFICCCMEQIISQKFMGTH